MALAQWAVLNNTLTPEQAQALVNEDQYPGQLVISVSLSPGQDLSELNGVSTGHLQDTTSLELKKSKEKVPLSRYVPPSESGNNEALFFFPLNRDGHELITLKEQEFRFDCKLNELTRLKVKFKLKDMVFDGQLEI